MIEKKHYKYVVYGLILFSAALFLLISQRLRAALFVSLFIVLNMILSSYKKFINAPIEIEVLTAGIVFCTLTFGVKAGLVVAILGGILSFIVGFNVSPFSFPMQLGYITIAVVSYLLRNYDLTTVGIIATIVNNVLVFTLYHFAFKYDLFKNVSFSVSNLIFNIILFVNVLPYLNIII